MRSKSILPMDTSSAGVWFPPRMNKKKVICKIREGFWTRNCFFSRKCLRCNKPQCSSCCSQLHSILTQMLDEPSTSDEDKKAIFSSLWYINVGKILSNFPTFNNSVINVGTCCEFSLPITKHLFLGVNMTFSKCTSHHLPREILSGCASLSDSDSNSDCSPDKVYQKITYLSLNVNRPLTIVHWNFCISTMTWIYPVHIFTMICH